jgi:hypothetical protein
MAAALFDKRSCTGGVTGKVTGKPRGRGLRRLLLAAAALPLMPMMGGLALAKLPDGWIKAGDRPNAYDMDVDPTALFGGKPSARVRSKEKAIDGFGTLMQTVKAGDYRGKRVRLTANVKTENVEDWAGLWMRVDSGNRRATSFDNMEDRPMKGTLDWKPYQVVLDVDNEADAVAFGILLEGTGTVWLNQARIEVVDKTVPTTGGGNKAPVNLDFAK